MAQLVALMFSEEEKKAGIKEQRKKIFSLRDRDRDHDNFYLAALSSIIRLIAFF